MTNPICFNNLYKDRTVLVTGHTGFKGSWLSLWLHILGAKVIGFSLEPPTTPNMFEILKLKDKMLADVRGDVRNSKTVLAVLKKYKPEIIFHLAAQPILKISYEKPKQTYETNINGVINIFEATKKIDSVKAVVNVTTDKCYQNKEWIYGYKEIDPLGGYDPYSSSKACSEIITGAYRNSFFNPDEFGIRHNTLIASARAGNVIGGGDWGKYRLIPDCAKFVSSNNVIKIRNPDATRPWQYVLEPLSGYLMLGARLLEGKKKFADAWNFGPRDADVIKVIDVVKIFLQSWGKGEFEITGNSSNQYEANLLKLDISKAQTKLNWKPSYNVKTSIEKTAFWYKQYYKGKSDLYDLSSYQIKEYAMNAYNNDVEWSR